ncbi:RidA family protein [Desulfococcaceae bacterium HSG8]|nr:RidA family protein [Desulfococcaceae bacterium HSG8]
MQRIIVSTDKAPGAIGPYSQAVKTDNMVFVSGQIAIDPASGELITDDIRKETRQVMTNLKEVLLEAGSSMNHIVKVTLFIKDMDQFSVINEVYGEFFQEQPPARACVEVSALPKGANVEAEAIALLGG